MSRNKSQTNYDFISAKDNFAHRKVCTLARLRRVQDLLSMTSDDGDDKPQAIICILGIDGQNNEGMRELANYLTCDLFSFVEKQTSSRTDGDADIFEDVAFVIRADRVDIFCNPVNYSRLLPYVAHWRHLRIHCLTEKQYHSDADEAEEFKIASFVEMVDGLSCVGIPYSSSGGLTERKFEPMVIEKWPLVQSFALENFGGQGFFTMKYKVIDVSREVHKVYTELDSVYVESLITEQLALFERQWNSLMAVCELHRRKGESDDALKESTLCEPLMSYFKHGSIVEQKLYRDKSSRMMLEPFVLFGRNTCRAELSKITHSMEGSIDSSGSVDRRPAIHMVCRGMAPKSPLKCTRTYLLHRDHSYMFDDGEEASRASAMLADESRILMNVYKGCVAAVYEAIYVYSHYLDAEMACEQANKVLMNCIEADIRLPSRDHVEIQLEVLVENERRDSIPLEPGVYLPYVKHVSVTVFDIPSPTVQGSHLGSVCCSDTFIDSSFPVKMPDGETELNASFCVLTSGISHFISWPMDELSQRLVSKVTVQSMSLLSGESATLCTDDCLAVFRQGELFISESDIVFLHQKSSGLLLPFSQIESVQFFDGGTMNSIAMLILNYKPEVVKSLPSMLCSRTSNWLVIALQPKTKAYRALFNTVLPVLKRPDRGLQFTSVDELPQELVDVYELLQNDYRLSVRESSDALTKARTKLSGLDKLLTHVHISCVGWQPVPSRHFSAVIGEEYDPGTFKQEQQMILYILIGASDAEFLPIVQRARSQFGVSLQVVRCPTDQTSNWEPNLLLSRIEDVFNSSESDDTIHVLLALNWLCDVVDVAQDVVAPFNREYSDSIRIGSVTVCIDVSSFYMTHSYSLPQILDNCVNGWANNVIIAQSATKTKRNKFDRIKQLVQAANPNVTVVIADDDGSVFTNRAIELILSPDSFLSAECIRARYLFTPKWYWAGFNTGTAFPPMEKVVLRFSQPLDRSRLSSRLKGLKSGLNRYPFRGNVYCVDGQLAFISDGGAEPARNSLSYNTLSGTLTTSAIKSAADPRDRNGTKFDCYVTFTGCALNEAKLKDMLRECLPPRRERKVYRTRESLTQTEIKLVHKEHHLDPLPAGWFYNGSHYVSMDGERTNIHPALEQFLSEYLKKVNDDVDRYNKTVADGKPVVDLFD